VLGGLNFQFPSDLLIQFRDGASSISDPEESGLGGMESTHGEAKCRGLSTYHFPVIMAMQNIGSESGRVTVQELSYIES
jgi:hypothetical protein